MMEQTKRLTICAMMAAVSVVLMLLGAVLQLGTYAAPLLTGMLLIPIGNRYGRKYQVMLWLVIAVLCFMLIPAAEQNMMFAGLFGWYPIAYPALQKLPKLLRLPVKLVLFNGAVIAMEALLLWVIAPEAMEPGMMLVLLALGNVTFLLYDYLIPKTELIIQRILRMK
ncbi:MAG: hypothetical protein IJA67_01195 [Oscillospiraceae bacterium]|nr:hypothetical protein [Oscillospiraceae bacterium]